MKSFGVILPALLAVALAAAEAPAQNGPPPGARPGAGAMAPQQGGGTIRGTVRDASGQPVRAARIAVWSAADSTLVTGGVSDNAGAFRIEGLRPGAYYLRVTMLGYTTGRVERVAVTPAAQTADVGEVRLAAEAVALEGISATAERSEVTQAVDRTVISARNMPAAAGGNATDVLRNVPGVEVDGEGKVSVRGNQNVAVQINGRPAPMRGDALTNFLKQLPASMVDRVEVVPNPSAKYDAEGMGGILNIVLRQDADLGTSGGFTLGMGTGDKYNGSANLGYQRGNLTLFGSYGLNLDQRGNRGYNRRENLYLTPSTFLDQEITGEFENFSHNFNASADLKLGKVSTLSATAMLGAFGGDIRNVNDYTLLDASRSPTARFDRITETAIDNTTADFSLGFRHTVQPQKNELSAEVRWNRNVDDNDSRFTLWPRTLAGVPADAATEIENTLTDSRYTNTVFQLDYTRQLNPLWKVETGYKGSLRDMDNAFDADRTVNGAPEAPRSNEFAYDEDVHAGYGTLTRDFGRLDVQAGARLEWSKTTYDDYTDLFPSASLMYELGSQQMLKASYSRRIQRPQTQFLNPFPFQEDPQNRFMGNPELAPEYTDSYELSYQRALPFGSLTLTPYYRRTTDAVRRYKLLDENGVSTTTFRNLATAESYGADVSSTVRLGDRFSGFASGSVFRVVTDGSNVESDLGSDALSWIVRGNLTYKVSPRLDLTWFQFYRAPMDVEQGRISGFSMANFALRHKLWGEKGSLSLRVSDPFDQSGFRFQTADESHVQDSRRKWDQRALFVTFNYTFGQQPRLRPRNQDGQQPPQQPGGDIGIN